jgi:hypothetical protein
MTYQNRVDLWSSFIELFPHSELADEAHFNRIKARFEAFREVGDPKQLRGINVQTIDLCREFEREFPDSYLADDALFLGLRLAYANRSEPDMYALYVALAQRHPNSDSFRRVEYRISEWIRSRHPVIVDANSRGVLLLRTATQHNPDMALNGFFSASQFQARDAMESRWLIRRLLGPDQKATIDDLPLRMLIAQVLMRWLGDTTRE